MSTSTLVRYTAIPLALGFGAFAAIVMTGPNSDDLSLTRLLVGFVAWLGVIGVVDAGMYLIDRKRPTGTLSTGKGPDCDRCGKPTRKPHLYNMPTYWWRCDSCEQVVTDILFNAATNGTLTESMLRYARPSAVYRVTEK